MIQPRPGDDAGSEGGQPSSALEGLTAVVTGAASGIGRATAEMLARAGATVVALDRQESSGTDQPRTISLIADVTDSDGLRTTLGEVVASLGGIDILVNNAGIGAVGTVEDGTDEEWTHVLDVNLLGVVRVTRAVLPLLRKSRHGAIVNVSSVVATTGVRERACSSASKGAVLALTLAMAADLISNGIRVNGVDPGTVDTPWVARLLDGAEDPAALRRALEQRQPLGRLGTSQEVAAAITFLASPDAAFITGTILRVDGGLSGVRI